MSPRSGLAILLVPVLIWSSTFVVVRLVMTDDTFVGSPFFFLALRFSIASMCFIPVLAVSNAGNGSVSLAALRPGFILGVLMLVGYSFQTFSLSMSSAGRVAFLTSLSVVILPIWEKFWGLRRMSHLKWLAVLSAVIGLGCLSHRDVGFHWSVGDLCAVLAMLAFSADYKYVEVKVSKHSPALLAAHSIVWLAIGSWILTLSLETQRWGAIGLRDAIAVLFVGILSTAVAFYLQNLCQRVVPARSAVFVFALESPIAAIIGYFALGEIFGRWEIAGAILVFCAVLLAEYPVRESLPRSDQASPG